ncbi:glycosyltransferase [Microvirga splendida]|uniref:Glycosyltransferase n=1 Tax=Microvirga splendida TaxID=2795727 RepID=A0ABS0Y8D8_9HYPH|nr:glycosyltransferase [Microvirga splendida]MBJ6128575.1 glycosyltransferase [Microvirga splendida]
MMKLSREQMNAPNSKIRLQNGRTSYPEGGDLTKRSLESYDQWIDTQIDFLKQFLQPEVTVVEIGVRADIHTLALAESVGADGVVYAYEPAGEKLDALRSLLVEKNARNVKVRELELKVRQIASPSDRLRTIAGSAERLVDAGELHLESSISNVALIKIDSARVGTGVINGLRSIISQQKPVIFVNFTSLDDAYAAMIHVSAFGYETFYVRNTAPNKSDISKSASNSVELADGHGTLFLPAGLKHEKIKNSRDQVRLTRIETLEDIAVAFLAKPRYGDRAAFDQAPKAWRDELARLRFQIAEANVRFEEASSSLNNAGKTLTTVADLREKLKVSNAKLRKSNEKLKAYRKKLKSREALIHQLYNSTSWKFARPIRAAQKVVRALRLKATSIVHKSSAIKAPVPSANQHGTAKKHPKAPQQLHGKAQEQDLEDVIVDAPKKVQIPAPPSWDVWEGLARDIQLRPAQSPSVDIVVPVYGQARETMNCLFHVLNAQQRTAYDLVVIDDCGPDPDLSRDLERLASMKLITLLKNERNLGFVATVNRGMELHNDRDVLLLNSDTAVHGNWLDRIVAFAEANRNVGTITPLSNNATICSYPKFVSDNDNELEIDDASLDRIAARVNAGKSVEIPTAVGFCMYISRACIDDVGLFDVETFGRGYGEENDFCRRAVKRGWSNVLIGNVFVRHYGGASFGETKKALAQEAQRRLEALHPEYSSTVREFILNDPVLDMRENLDIERLRLHAQADGPAMLFITLGRGGGTERHVEEMQRALKAEGVPVFILRSNPKQPGTLQFGTLGLSDVPNLPSFSVPYDPSRLVDVINKFNVKHIHVQHLADTGEGIERMIREAAYMAGIQYDVTVHDYMYVCPRITLISHSGVYCGEPEPAACNTCLATMHSIAGNETIEAWRGKFGTLLAGARSIFVPSDDVAARMNTYFPHVTFTVRPHVTVLQPRDARPRADKSERYVAVIGAIGPHKGATLLAECARYALAYQLPIKFVIVGYISNEYKLHTFPNVIITGRYAEDELQGLLAEQAPDIAWFPSVLPETFSYTLSSAMEAGVFPVVFDLGAPADRLRALHWGGIMPAEYMLSAPDILQFLLSVQIEPAPQDLAEAVHVSYKSILKDYYGLDFSQHGVASELQLSGT